MIHDGPTTYGLQPTLAAGASSWHGQSAGRDSSPGETCADDICLKPNKHQMLQTSALDLSHQGQSGVVDPPDTPNTVPHQIPALCGSSTECSDGQMAEALHHGTSLNHEAGGWRLTIRRSLDLAKPGAGSSPSVRQLLLRRPTADIIDAIRLGPLLGAGSFGKVYQAQLGSVAVAVKIMETHNPHLSAKVANELEVMMRLAHPNIVQALHIALWQRPAADSTRLSVTQDAAGFDLGVADISDATTVTFTNSSSFCIGSQTSSTKGQQDAAADAHAHPAACCLQRGSLSDHPRSRDQMGTAAQTTTTSSSTNTSSSSSGHGVVHGRQPAGLAKAGADGAGWCGQLEESRAWLVLELCDGGTLEEAIQAGRYMKQDGQPDMLLLLSHLLDIAKGMAYLHEQHVLHADLKPANVLLCSPGEVEQSLSEEDMAPTSCCTSPAAKAQFRDMQLKISDFGLSHGMALGQSHHQTATVGTLSHMAPEVLQEGRLSTAADVYSFGVLMWEVVHSMRAFRGCFNEAQMLERVLSGERPAFTHPTTPGFVELTAACWAADAGQRPTFRKVVRRLNTLLQVEQQQRQLHRQTVRIGRPSLLLMEGSLSAGSEASSTPRGAPRRLSAAGSDTSMAPCGAPRRLSALMPAVSAACSDASGMSCGAPRRLSALLPAVSSSSSMQHSPGSAACQPAHGAGIAAGLAEGSSHGSRDGMASNCSGGCALGRASSLAAAAAPPPPPLAAAAATSATMPVSLATVTPQPQAGQSVPSAYGSAGRGPHTSKFHRQLQQLQAQLHSWQQWRPVSNSSKMGSTDRGSAFSGTSGVAATSSFPASTQAAAAAVATEGCIGTSTTPAAVGSCSPAAAGVPEVQEGTEPCQGGPSEAAAAACSPKARRKSLLLDKGGYSGWW